MGLLDAKYVEPNEDRRFVTDDQITKWDNFTPLSITELRALIAVPTTPIYVSSNGGGMFVYDPTDTTSVDNVGTVLVTATGKRFKRQSDYVTPQMFGAIGDGTHDDSDAIIAALTSGKDVLFPVVPGYYKVTKPVQITGITNSKVVATGAKIGMTDLTKAFIKFSNCTNITITGGTWTYMPQATSNATATEHILEFILCANILVEKAHVYNSPEMGIALNNVVDATIQNCLIERTWRDGTYAHYSANVRYLNNTYRNVKDDAMSFHDYGISAQKTFIAGFGYTQSSNFIASGNIVENCYQGMGCVSSKGLTIINNSFTNTVLAGIAVVNSKLLFEGGTAVTSDVLIESNTFKNVCSPTTINGISYTNGGQANSGRAAIVIASLGTANQITLAEPKTSTNIRIRNNTVLSSGALGMHVSQTTGLNHASNIFKNCVVSGNSLGGAVVEVWSVTNYAEEGTTTVIDERTTIQHANAYSFNGVFGVRKDWIVTNITGEESIQVNSLISRTDTKGALLNAQVPVAKEPINVSVALDWNTLISAGVHQVYGTFSGGTNLPSTLGLLGAGTLTVMASADTLTQIYTDYLGRLGFRHRNGTVWSEWQLVLSTPDTAVQGDLFQFNGSVMKRIPKGTDGQVLAMVAGAPAWKTLT